MVTNQGARYIGQNKRSRWDLGRAGFLYPVQRGHPVLLYGRDRLISTVDGGYTILLILHPKKTHYKLFNLMTLTLSAISVANNCIQSRLDIRNWATLPPTMFTISAIYFILNQRNCYLTKTLGGNLWQIWCRMQLAHVILTTQIESRHPLPYTTAVYNTKRVVGLCLPF